MLLCFPTRHSRAMPSRTARARHSLETPFPSLSYCKYATQAGNNPTSHHTIPHPIIPVQPANFIFGIVPVQRISFIFGDSQRNLATAAQRVSFIFGDGQRNLATAAQRVSFIFGDCQRNLATACATRIFYLWRRPAQVGDSRAYLWRRPAQLGDGQRKCGNVNSR